MSSPSRETAIDIAHAALLVVDMQNYCAHPNGAWWRDHEPPSYFFASLERVVLPNLVRLLAVCRRAKIEIVYSVIENMTWDGRDRSLDYRISAIDVPPRSWDAAIIDEIAPMQDELVFRKTSSNVFVSTNIDYVLRNLGIRSVIIGGVMTEQCVESAVRTASDLGYLVTLVRDCCTTSSAERHTQSLIGIRGYCRQRMTDELLDEITVRSVDRLDQ